METVQNSLKAPSPLSIALIAVLLAVSWAAAGLDDIRPRPQQMGNLAVSPVIINGAMELVMPDSPTPMEANVRDEYVAQLTIATGSPPGVIEFSDWTPGNYALWIGTPGRFQPLLDSLEATRIPGLGALSREEEYQLYVGENICFLAGNDQLGLLWGLYSLLELLGGVNGQTTIDRAYVRDWPDFEKRISTVNSSIRIQSQYDYCDSLINWAFHCKMDEIEWNDPDGGHEVRSDFAWTHALLLRERLARRGMTLTFGTDLTGLRVTEKGWQEGVPIQGLPMTVGTTGFTPLSYGITVNNGGFEAFTGNVPNSWTMYPSSGYALLSRDATQHHSGASSLRWANMTSDYQWDRTVHQRLHFGNNRMMRLRFWYKTSDFHGRIRIIVLGDEPVDNHFVNGRNSVPVTAGWTEVTVDFSTFNVDTASLWIGPEEYSSGTLWLDDITVENAGPMRMLRRDDTPVAVYKQPGNILMTENVDYTIVDTDTAETENFLLTPRLARVNGGGLAVGNQVTVDWYTAILFQGGRETVCWSMLEPLEYYQGQIRTLDSTLAPDGIKIHMNEVTLAGYDPNCTQRGLTPGQLVGAYVDEMCDIVQARRPGMPVRGYGDPFDVWVKDNRCHPVTTSPWTVGSLQQLDPYVEMMVMTDYTRNADSSFAYFNANGHSAVLAWTGSNPFRKAVDGALAARRAANCTGLSIYDWALDAYSYQREFASLGWNIGPFFLHSPPLFVARPDTVFLACEIWSDSFLLADPTAITSRTLSYRFVPEGNWTTVTPQATAPRTYRTSIIPPANATGIEYYFRATDHRNQTRNHPPDAPARIFSALLPESNPNEGTNPHVYDGTIQPHIDGQTITWPEWPGANGYEIHATSSTDLLRPFQTLVATVPSGQTMFFLDPTIFPDLKAESLIVLAVAQRTVFPEKSAIR